MNLIINRFSMNINNESRWLISVKDPSTPYPLEFQNTKTIIGNIENDFGDRVIHVYTTTGSIYRTYPPDEKDNFYVYWFVLDKVQDEAATIANQLAEQNVVLAEANGIIGGVDTNGNPV